jgi:phage shock protein A
MAQKIDQIEAEAEAQTDLAEEYSGDVLSSKFDQLERTSGGEEDLVALKRKMGMLPAEEEPAVAAPSQPVQARVEAPRPASNQDQEELAAALEELEAEQHSQEKRKAGR